MSFTKSFFLSVLFSSTLLSYGSFNEDPSDGNRIPEPTLSDYRSATRAPGILVEPSDNDSSESSF